MRRTEGCHGNFIISHVKLQINAEISRHNQGEFVTYDTTIHNFHFLRVFQRKESYKTRDRQDGQNTQQADLT